MRIAPCLLATLLLPASVHSADTALGRLFFSPQERAELEALREPAAPASPAVSEQAVHLKGLLLRQGQLTTVWLNDAKPAQPAQLNARGSTPAQRSPQLQLRQPGLGAALPPLKVGQTLDLATGQLSEAYQSPRVQSKPILTPANPAAKRTLERP
ncbi:hypothetical protein [Chitinimonas taiwanensis]|uniref:Uncharacterized protein n=1 Tax=Chitinimonas taiwanensis DSM 18899 TaxID=1121279 RepID=A0A1K2HLP1_9NEIS|nr:hypothetical protein [Chitinimonas taiwanensis]SFZ77170.1 hypothetical protein SAMN02745887_02260 [Chitinimonas taiwanensis DSM 18899]